MKIITIGRANENDIILTDTRVSRQHAQIVQADNGTFTITDLNSLNGTFVNGQRIYGCVSLRENDMVQVGDSTISWQNYFGHVSNDYAPTQQVVRGGDYGYNQIAVQNIQLKCPDCGRVFQGDACPNCGCPANYCSIMELNKSVSQLHNTPAVNNSPFSGSTGDEKRAYSMAENALIRYPVSPIFKENFQVTDTNGPMGDCLFPKGKIIYQGIVEAPCSKEELKEYAIRFFKELGKDRTINVKTIQTEYESRYDFDVILASGKTRQEGPGNYVKYYRDRSRIRCHVALEFKERRYRYTVNPYETNRLNLRGKAKCDGPPNELHWQRVNSLIKKRDRHFSWSRKYKVYQALINNEIDTYYSEYNVVMKFINLLANYYYEMHKETDF